MSWKNFAKRFAFLRWVNSQLKGRQLKRHWVLLRKGYDDRAKKKQLVYDSSAAIDAFRASHSAIAPNFRAREYGRLRVFWVGSNLDQDESGFLQALRRVAEVKVFYNFKGGYGTWSIDSAQNKDADYEWVRNVNDRELIAQVSSALTSGGVDIVIGQMWAHRISSDALVTVMGMGVPVINISMDDRLPENWDSRAGVRQGSIGLVPGVSLVLTTSPETCLWYGVEDCPAIFWPLASCEEIFGTDGGVIRDIDVLFIGNKYGVRQNIIEYLEENGVNIECFGVGWPNGYANVNQMTSLSKRAKIILGIGAIGHCFDMYTLKLRDFDAPMSGALYLTQRNPDLCELFIEGIEIECYETCHEALEKINYYLLNHDERLRVAEMGRKRAIAEHTWRRRLEGTFRDLGLLL